MDKKEKLPGTGEYIAYFNPFNRRFKPVEYRLPQSLIDEMKPSFNKLKKLLDKACLLYVNIWKLADKRCRDLMQEESTGTLGRNPRKDAEYRHEQIRIYIKLQEIEEKMSNLVYGQFRKGLDSGFIPEEVSSIMTGALRAYEELGIPYSQKLLEMARGKAKKIEQEIRDSKHEKLQENLDIVMECIKAQQIAYHTSDPMNNILKIKPFYDGSWVYFGNDVVDRKSYEFASSHDFDWALASAKGHGGIHGNSPETFDYIKPMIKKEYGI